MSQGRLLQPQLGLPTLLREFRPATIPFQDLLQQQRDFVGDIVAAGNLRMLLLERGNALLQIAAVIAGDHPRRAGLSRGLLQLTVDGCSVGVLDWFQRDNFQIVMRQFAAELSPLRQANADNQQALGLANLHRVINQPSPIIGAFLRSFDGVQSQPQQPHLDRTRGGQVALRIEAQLRQVNEDGCGASQAHGRTQDESQGLADDAEAVTASGRRNERGRIDPRGGGRGGGQALVRRSGFLLLPIRFAGERPPRKLLRLLAATWHGFSQQPALGFGQA